jgi:hypothetical protein
MASVGLVFTRDNLHKTQTHTKDLNSSRTRKLRTRSSHPLIYRAITKPLNQKDYLLNHFCIKGNKKQFVLSNFLAYLKYYF